MGLLPRLHVQCNKFCLFQNRVGETLAADPISSVQSLGNDGIEVVSISRPITPMQQPVWCVR